MSSPRSRCCSCGHCRRRSGRGRGLGCGLGRALVVRWPSTRHAGLWPLPAPRQHIFLLPGDARTWRASRRVAAASAGIRRRKVMPICHCPVREEFRRRWVSGGGGTLRGALRSASRGPFHARLVQQTATSCRLYVIPTAIMASHRRPGAFQSTLEAVSRPDHGSTTWQHKVCMQKTTRASAKVTTRVYTLYSDSGIIA